MEPAIIRLMEQLRLMGCTIDPCGSRVTCNPAPEGTDADFLVEVPSSRTDVANIDDMIRSAGFSSESDEHYQDAEANGFLSFRCDDVNFIVTANARFAAKHRVATKLCTRLNLLDKADRVAVFQAVLYAKGAE